MATTRKQRPSQVSNSPLVAWMYGPVAATIWNRSPFGTGGWLRKRHKHVTNVGTEPVERCACRAFKICDSYFTAHAAELRPIWNPAVKMQPLSGYKLWMKECCISLARFGTIPDAPSPSGGFSKTFIGPGTNPPADEWYVRNCINKYNCVDGVCVEQRPADFKTLEECRAVCELPPANCPDDCDLCPTDIPLVLSQFDGVAGTGHWPDTAIYTRNPGETFWVPDPFIFDDDAGNHIYVNQPYLHCTAEPTPKWNIGVVLFDADWIEIAAGQYTKTPSPCPTAPTNVYTLTEPTDPPCPPTIIVG